MSLFTKIDKKLLQLEPFVDKYLARKETVKHLPSADILKSSLLAFTQFFYKARTNRDFIVRPAIGRPSFCDVVIPLLEKTTVHDPEVFRLMINCPPRYGKTEIVCHYIAWALANYPDSNFLYLSYSTKLAVRHTKLIRQIISLPEYGQLFGIKIRADSKAANDFTVNTGGSVYGTGAGGTITGLGAGIQGCDRFGGTAIIDDIHKPDDVPSELIRENLKNWWHETFKSRVNDPKRTPIILIGQRVHEDDIPAFLKNHNDTETWNCCVLPALDVAENPLMPDLHTKEMLLTMKDKKRYVYAAQYQQDPNPPGDGLYRRDDFLELDEIPDNILATIITVDTAETTEEYNDATAFSFFGLYKVKYGDHETDKEALHWIDCEEMRIEPRDLKQRFLEFLAGCMRFPIKPKFILIEKKSTGVSLISSLKNELPGIRIIEVDRTKKSGSKSTRFVQMQDPIAEKLVTLTKNSSSATLCINHMIKITANDTHRHDDIADTCYDAVKYCLLDKAMSALFVKKETPFLKGYQGGNTNRLTPWNS